jgi:hypothetical protein
LELSEQAQDPERRRNLAALAETWTKLAAELESEQALLNALSDLTLDEPSSAEGSEHSAGALSLGEALGKPLVGADVFLTFHLSHLFAAKFLLVGFHLTEVGL